MNLKETIARIFPAGFVKEGDAEHGNHYEVHGLPKHTVPRNCQVLASGQFQFSPGQELRESYLVKTEDFVLFFRICQAPPDSGYAEFAESCGPAPIDKGLAH